MIEQKYFCCESSDRNRAMHHAILDAAPGSMQGMPDGLYQTVYFYLYPADGEHADVELTVTSSYRRHINFGQIKRRFDTHYLLRKCHFERRRLP
ncbi:hypothetical protein AWJ14_06835 [Hoeflea olei]|uniref:Uncharacterized protein n=2 Tax=Hoeflea olei TaxID=1480615 RepID=A0A1C1YTQ2_9HYPH|nr:hypothetical protein AWJ14_06835 [Hoeflea olei]